MTFYPDLTKVKKILVVKLRLHGDVLLTAPFLFHLKRALPQADITTFVYAETWPMLSGLKEISDCLLYDKSWKKLSFWKRLWKEFTLLRHIRKAEYDLVINLTEGDRGALAALVSGASCRVGFDPGKSGFFGKRKIYTHLARLCQSPRHTIEKNLDVLRRIGIFPERGLCDFSLHIPEEAKARIQEFLTSQGLKANQYILIHPFASHLFKSPSPEQISHLIESLHVQGKKVVLSCGPSPIEKVLLEKILSGAPDGSVVAAAGLFSLKEFAALICLAQVLISVDTVSLHIASALKTPVVALFGPTSEKMWGPWQHPKSIVVSEDLPCRPCYLDGCGGSKRSECLYSLPTAAIVNGVNTLTKETSLSKLSLLEMSGYCRSKR